MWFSLRWCATTYVSQHYNAHQLLGFEPLRYDGRDRWIDGLLATIRLRLPISTFANADIILVPTPQRNGRRQEGQITYYHGTGGFRIDNILMMSLCLL